MDDAQKAASNPVAQRYHCSVLGRTEDIRPIKLPFRSQRKIEGLSAAPSRDGRFRQN